MLLVHLWSDSIPAKAMKLCCVFGCHAHYMVINLLLQMCLMFVGYLCIALYVLQIFYVCNGDTMKSYKENMNRMSPVPSFTVPVSPSPSFLSSLRDQGR